MGYEPENTLLSVQKALDLGCDMIEVDVHLCISGELVVIHDDTLDRTTNGQGKVGDFTLPELQKLNAGKNQKIPTLKDVIELVNKSCQLNIELKGNGTALKVAELIHLYLQKGWAENDFIISSFNHIELLEFKKAMPAINIGVLIYHLPHDLAKIGEELNAFSLNVSSEFITADLVNDAHKRKLKIFVYTVNSKLAIKEVKALGVDGIFSNYPDRL